jgi:hypothetical protein
MLYPEKNLGPEDRRSALLATASALNAGWSPLAENYGAITAARASLLTMGGIRRRPSIVLTMVTVV